MNHLWTPVTVGRLELSHRLAMAPMTRSRATSEGVPTAMNAEYYAQRASLGLLISEGTQPSEDGQGYMATPGIHTRAQVEGWRAVADAVRDNGGHLYIQLMHAGRIGHPSNTTHGRTPVAPSPVRADGSIFTPTGLVEMPQPRELEAAEIRQTVDDFRRAATNAIAAGAEGVELHCANGYLLHQFLAPNANRRDDAYGGSVENRVRFPFEVAKAVAEEIGADRTAARISPGNPTNDIVEDAATLEELVARLATLELAYLHVMHFGDDEVLRKIRAMWPTSLVVDRAGRDRELLGADIEAGLADVETVGSFALANPDLVARLRSGASLNDADMATFYGGDARGYTDYPTLEESAA
jgi:N-ethylmaleimide reductase